jgi:hypothetical protein
MGVCNKSVQKRHGCESEHELDGEDEGQPTEAVVIVVGVACQLKLDTEK